MSGAAAETLPEPTGKTILDLADDDCRWPIGQDAYDRFRFCGCPRHRLSYCKSHGVDALLPPEVAARKIEWLEKRARRRLRPAAPYLTALAKYVGGDDVMALPSEEVTDVTPSEGTAIRIHPFTSRP